MFEKESIKWCPKLFYRRVNSSFKDVLSALLSCDILLKQFILLKVNVCLQIVLVYFLLFSTVLETCIYKFYRSPPCFAQFQMWLSSFSHTELRFAFPHKESLFQKVLTLPNISSDICDKIHFDRIFLYYEFESDLISLILVSLAINYFVRKHRHVQIWASQSQICSSAFKTSKIPNRWKNHSIKNLILIWVRNLLPHEKYQRILSTQQGKAWNIALYLKVFCC